MKEKIIDLKRLNTFSMFVAPVIFSVFMIPYAMYTTVSIKDNFTLWTFLSIIIAMVVGIVIHELIHALCFVLFTEKGFKSIRFGAYWKQMAFYCHCSEMIKVKHYRITLLMPSIVLGLIPLVIAFVIQNFPMLFFACMMLTAGLGDYSSFWLLRNLDKNSMVMDHPEKVGFYYTADSEEE